MAGCFFSSRLPRVLTGLHSCRALNAPGFWTGVSRLCIVNTSTDVNAQAIFPSSAPVDLRFPYGPVQHPHRYACPCTSVQVLCCFYKGLPR